MQNQHTMTPEEISRKAAEERNRENRKRKKWNFNFFKKKFTPYTPYTWKVFRAIHPPSGKTMLVIHLLLFPATIGLVLGFILKENWPYYVYPAIGCVAIIMLLFSIDWVAKRIQFQHYKDWDKKLPFPVTGWERVNGFKHFPAGLYWMDYVEVTVELLPEKTDQRAIQFIHDALFLYRKKANSCFYSKEDMQAGYMGEIRKKWEMQTPLQIGGSANGEVMGHVHHLIEKHLVSIQKKIPCIQRITIVYKGNVYKVAPVRVSSD